MRLRWGAAIACVLVASCLLDRSGTRLFEETSPAATASNASSSVSSGAGGMSASSSSASSSASNGAGGGSECATPDECPIPSKSCVAATCNAGKCGTNNKTPGSACNENAGDVCDGKGNCLKSQGKVCGGSGECLTGFCADSVCCDAACVGPCVACNIANKIGACTPEPPATNPENGCVDGAKVCDGFDGCVDGSYSWAFSYGDMNGKTQEVRGLATDGANIYAVGYFDSTIDFSNGSAPMTSQQNGDGFVAKLDDKGAQLWSKKLAGDGEQTASAAAVDHQGNVIVVGSFEKGIDLGDGKPLMSAGNYDIFVVKYDGTGKLLWKKAFGDGNVQLGIRLAIDSANNVVLVGGFMGQIDFGGGKKINSAGDYDVYVAKLDPSGNAVWANKAGDGALDIASDVAIDAQDNVIVTGSFGGKTAFTPQTMTSKGSFDAFLVLFNSAGAAQWQRQYGGTDTDIGVALALDDSNRVFTTGYFKSANVSFGGGMISSAGNEDVYLVRLDVTGKYLGSNIYGDAASQKVSRIAWDGHGGILLAGNYMGSLTIQGVPMAPNGLSNIYLAKLAIDSTNLKSNGYGGPGIQALTALATDKFGNAIIGGFYDSTLALGGPTSLTTTGFEDAFLAKYLR